MSYLQAVNEDALADQEYEDDFEVMKKSVYGKSLQIPNNKTIQRFSHIIITFFLFFNLCLLIFVACYNRFLF